MIERLHQIKDIELLISYIDPRDNDLLPINNDDNFVRAVSTAQPLLRLIIQRKGMCAVQPVLCCAAETIREKTHFSLSLAQFDRYEFFCDLFVNATLHNP